jgi:hemolysin activation/secretion protein
MTYSTPPPELPAIADLPEVMQPGHFVTRDRTTSTMPSASALAHPSGQETFAPESSATLPASEHPVPPKSLTEEVEATETADLPVLEAIAAERHHQETDAPVAEAERTPPITNAPEPSPESTPDQFRLRELQVTGSSVLSDAEIDAIAQPFVGELVTLADLQGIADEITQLYLERGYLTSRAVLAPQTIADGVVQIRAIEGSLEQIAIENEESLHVKPSYIRSRLRRSGTPLNIGKLEDQLRLLKANPLFTNIEAKLQPGTQVGQSILVVRVVEAPQFAVGVSADNYSPPSVGSERLGANLRYRNPLGLGDELAGSYYRSTTGGADVFDFTYRVPLNAMDGTLQLRAAPSRNEITENEFEELDIEGETDLYAVSYRQPLVRSPREEFALSVGFTFQEGQTFVFNNIPFPFGIGPDAEGVSRTSVMNFGQDYVRRDAGGAWALRSRFNIGTGLFDATDNSEPIPDGQFFSWLGQVQRVQQLGTNHQLLIQADLQLTPNSLLPSQQFVIGGGQSLRGYRQNVRSADNGFRLSIEDRITLQRNAGGIPTLQLAPFIDVGAVWNHPDNPNPLPDERFLAGAGLGLLWSPLPRLNLRLDYGVPLVGISDEGDNIQDEGFYFSVGYGI